MKYTAPNNLLDVLLALEERIMKTLNVGTLALVTNIDSTNKKCNVKIFPSATNDSKEIVCMYGDNIVEENLTLGSIVIILFLDKDFRQNLTTLSNDIVIVQKNTNNILHSDLYGIVIGIFKKKEVI